MTTTTSDRKPFPGLPASYNVIEKNLFETAPDKSIGIFAYVIMPSHLHLLLGSCLGGPGLSRFMHSFKGRTREAILGKGRFWQKRFDDLVIFSPKVFETKLNYIHFNPVRAGMVKNPEDWPYSSHNDWIHQQSLKGVYFAYQAWYNGEGIVDLPGAVGSGDPTAQF